MPAVKHQPAALVSVKTHGAKGDGATDDRAAIQAAIDAVGAAGGGTVFFPAGTYLVKTPVRTTNPSTTANEGHGLYVAHDDVTLAGAGRGATVIELRPYANVASTMETSWQTVSSKVWRGAAVFVVGGATAPATRRNVTIRDLTLFGGCEYTGDTVSPANTSTGDGWDITHKGVWLWEDRYHDNISIVDCEIHGFKGELVYGGGPYIGSVVGRGLLLHDTNADGWSVTSDTFLADSEIHTCAHAGVEDRYVGASPVWQNLDIHDCDDHGLSISCELDGSPPGPYGPALLTECHIHDCDNNGIYLAGVQHLVVENNTVVDCGVNANKAGIRLLSEADKPVDDVTIRHNRIQSSAQNVTAGIYIGQATTAMERVRVYDNVMETTEEGRDASKAMTAGLSINGTVTDLFTRNNEQLYTTYTFTQSAQANDSLLTTTGATVVAQLRPARQGNFVVYATYRVVTNTTTVTITVTYRDSSGAQTATLVNAESKAVGTYTLAPLFINAIGSSESYYIKVNATAGTANQVYVSAAIRET